MGGQGRRRRIESRNLVVEDGEVWSTGWVIETEIICSHLSGETKQPGEGLRPSSRGTCRRTYMVEATSMRRVRMWTARRRPARERPD